VTLPQAIPFLNWSWDYFLFLNLVVVLLGSAIMTVLGRNIIHSGLWMIVCFGALAGLYVLLQAPLVAAAQVLIYIGAISVLVLFAIMLTQTKMGPARLVFHRQASGAAVAAIVLAAILLLVVVDTNWPGQVGGLVGGVVGGAVGACLNGSPVGPCRTATDALARLLFDRYVLPFEVVSVLLLAAVIGGVYLAKREPDEPSGP
jgi:NADH-quinone oxidoreductase subunit J